MIARALSRWKRSGPEDRVCVVFLGVGYIGLFLVLVAVEDVSVAAAILLAVLFGDIPGMLLAGLGSAGTELLKGRRTGRRAPVQRVSDGEEPNRLHRE